MKPLTNKPGRGVLFKVEDKSSPKAPDWRGGLNLNGVEYELAAWGRESARGTSYVSLSISLPRDEATTADARAAAELERSFDARR